MTIQAQASALTAHHPTPSIMDETFPDNQTALAGLPEERTTVTLPILTGQFFQTEDMDEEEATGLAADPPIAQFASAPMLS